MVILDDDTGNFRYQKENGIQVTKWKGDMGDRELEDIKVMLLGIVRDKKDDVKAAVSQFKKERISGG